jgi:large subunit ribosomal protein L25
MSDSLEVVARNTTGSRDSRRLRRQGMVPAVLYGHGEKCVDLAARREALEAVVRHGSRIVELKGAVKTSALVRDMQWDTFGVEPLHVDFVRVDKTERIKVRVPLELRGDAPGHRAGGTVNMVLHDIEIECTPDTIPEKIHVHVGKLEVGGAIKVHDIELPKGLKAVTDGDETAVSCLVPTHKAEEAGIAGVAEPEIIGRKASEEGEAAGEG